MRSSPSPNRFSMENRDEGGRIAASCQFDGRKIRDTTPLLLRRIARKMAAAVLSRRPGCVCECSIVKENEIERRKV